MGLFKKIMNQTRKPQGFLGGMMLDGMNNGHAKVADWGLAHLTTIAPEKILEVGCGGGRNAYQLLQKYPSSKLTAVDYSETSLEKTKQFNSEMIKKGRCNVQKGDVSALNIDEQYDLATAFETKNHIMLNSFGDAHHYGKEKFEKNLGVAEMFYRKAAEYGDLLAKLNLAYMIWQGEADGTDEEIEELIMSVVREALPNDLVGKEAARLLIL